MTSGEFMCEAVAGRLKPSRTSWARRCASVLYDGTHVYSYGGHYPLLIKLETADGPRWILNDSGYSSTTGRHISYARPLADAAVSMPRGGSTYPEDIKIAAENEIPHRFADIETLRTAIVKRPRFEATYNARIERSNARIRNLRHAIAICEAAEEFANLKK